MARVPTAERRGSPSHEIPAKRLEVGQFRFRMKFSSCKEPMRENPP